MATSERPIRWEIIPLNPEGERYLNKFGTTSFLVALLIAIGVSIGACGTDATPTPGPDAREAAVGLQQDAGAGPEATNTPASLSDLTAPATATPDARAPSATLAAPDATSTAQDAATLVSGLGNEAWARLVTLTEEVSPRESATAEEMAAADYLVEEFEAMGYEAEVQPFTVEVLSRENPLVALTGPMQLDVEGFPLVLSGVGQTSGIVVDVGKAFPEDIPRGGIQGRIALVQRGTITFEEKVARVADAGALAAVVYNNRSGPFLGSLSNQARIPAVAVSGESGRSIKELMAKGDVTATVSVIMETRESRNVVAEKQGRTASAGVVILGGHYDTVSDTEGANDNGSGIATLLTVARVVSEKSYPFTLRFIAFGAEEIGLFGSRFYVDSLSSDERMATIAMLNFDVPGSGEVAEVLGSVGLVEAILDYGGRNGIDVRRGVPLEGASSDHAPFMEVGIPAVFFLADDLSRINAPGDDLEFVRPELMGAAAALGLALLDSLAER